MPDPPVELTVSKEKPRGAVEEAVKTFPSFPERGAKALVPEAIRTPRVKVLAPLPPLPTPKGLVSVSEEKLGVVVTAKVMLLVVVEMFILEPFVRVMVDVLMPPKLLMIPLVLKVFHWVEVRKPLSDVVEVGMLSTPEVITSGDWRVIVPVAPPRDNTPVLVMVFTDRFNPVEKVKTSSLPLQ